MFIINGVDKVQAQTVAPGDCCWWFLHTNRKEVGLCDVGHNVLPDDVATQPY